MRFTASARVHYLAEVIALQDSISDIEAVFLEREGRLGVGACQGEGEPRAMNDQRILDELLGLLEGQGVTIRREPLGGTGGGLCAVRGSSQFFVDTEADSAEMSVRCAEAVGKVLDVETIYIRPEVRQFIEAHCGSRPS